MKLDTFLKCLGSGVVVYVVVAACGSETSSNPPSQKLPDSPLDGAVTNPVPDAVAQTSGSSCGPCTLSGPITLGGLAKVITADMDPAQWVGGNAKGRSQRLAEGPLFATDARIDKKDELGVQGLLYVGIDCACTKGKDVGIIVSTGISSVQGVRYFVPAGSFLCADVSTGGTAELSWSGFRPYTP